MNLLKLFTKKRTILFVFVFFFITACFSSSVQAFSTPSDATYQLQFEQAVYQTEEMNLQSYVYETMKAIAASAVTRTTGCFTCPPEERGTGLINTTIGLIASLYAHPPASGIDYVAYMRNKLDLAPAAYAQGEGYEKMKPFLSIWQAFRNITYLFFVLIFVFIGFAIMFRVKISPQTVITIQSALPRIVIALILVTFSYAIVGFLIDLMFVVTNLIVYTFKTVPNIPEWIKSLIPGGALVTRGDIGGTMMIVGIPTVMAPIIIFLAISSVSGLATMFFGGIQIALAIDIIVLIILVAIFLIALLRVFWTLLKAYVLVVIALIFGPFQILLGTLPGSNAISSWFKGLLANLAVLPTVLAMVFLSGYITLVNLGSIGEMIVNYSKGIISWNTLTQGISQEPVDLGGFIILTLVSVGILLMTPKAADMIKAFITGQPFGYGAAIGEAFGPAIFAGGLAKEAGVSWGKGYFGERGRIAAGARAAREAETARVSGERPPVGTRTPRGSEGPSV